MTSMYYLNIFGGLTKPAASDFWWQMENIWWLTPPNHLIYRALRECPIYVIQITYCAIRRLHFNIITVHMNTLMSYTTSTFITFILYIY